MTSTIAPGTIVTIAGTGDPGYAGDGGPGLKAMLNEPKSITIVKNYLYIADAENHRIRRLDLQSGIIITVAGIGSAADAPRSAPASVPAGLPLEEDPLADPDAKKEARFVQLPDQSGTVRFVTGAAAKGRFKGDGGPAAQATLNFPSAIAVDSRGVVYIADTFNHRIRRVDAASGLISTVAGTGAPRFSGDNGPADKAALNEPVALALHEETHRLYIADLANYRVRAVDLSTGRIFTYAGSGYNSFFGIVSDTPFSSLSFTAGGDGDRWRLDNVSIAR